MRKSIFCFAILLTSFVFLSAELSPKEAVTYIEDMLLKKGFKGLEVGYRDIKDSEQHDIYIEFGTKSRSIRETDNIIYESALIIGKLNWGDSKPNFKINMLRFTRNWKLVSRIHSRYCSKIFWDESMTTHEKEQFILSKLQHER